MFRVKVEHERLYVIMYVTSVYDLWNACKLLFARSIRLQTQNLEVVYANLSSDQLLTHSINNN